MKEKRVETTLTPAQLEQRGLAKFEPGSRIGTVIKPFYIKNEMGFKAIAIEDQIELVN